MYLEHFGLHDAPFRITPHPDFFYAGAQRGEILAALRYALQFEDGIIKVTGEVGTGKTMQLRMLLEGLPTPMLPVWLANPSLPPADLLAAIAEQIGAHERATAGQGPLLDAIQKQLIALFADGRRVVALVDEAHAMAPEALEQIRLLSNLETPRQKLLQIVLFGQPELDEILATRAMRPLRERITHHFVVAPLAGRDIAAYIGHRLHTAGYRGRPPFTAPALWVIRSAAKGLTRRVNILADKALLAAFSDATHRVSYRHARLAVRDAGLAPGGRARGLVALGAVAALTLAVWGMHRLPAAPAAPLRPHATPASSPATAPRASIPTPASTPASAEPLGAPLAARLHSSQQALAALPGDHWCVQLEAAAPNQADDLARFVQRLDEAKTGQPIYLYAAPGPAPTRLGVVWGDFATRAAASRALAAQPGWVRAHAPYVRSFASLRPRAPASAGNDGIRLR